MDALPSLVLWAWERPEDLRFLRSDGVGVAFLANTIHLRGDETAIRPRFQPLKVSNQTKLIAVTRIEAEPAAALSREQMQSSVQAIAKSASLPRISAVQVDFDATRSQRDFYRQLLLELRARLGPGIPISMTALASWCFDDAWIKGLPVDEAVPMLFRMGAGTNEVVARLAAGRDFGPAVCRSSLGVSTDERWQELPGGRRTYVFDLRPWTEQAESAFLWEAHRWR